MDCACGKPVKVKGMCSSCYGKNYRKGACPCGNGEIFARGKCHSCYDKRKYEDRHVDLTQEYLTHYRECYDCAVGIKARLFWAKKIKDIESGGVVTVRKKNALPKDAVNV